MSNRLNVSIIEGQREQREAAERIAARDGSLVGVWPEDKHPGIMSAPVGLDADGRIISPHPDWQRERDNAILAAVIFPERVPGPAAVLAQVADDYGIHELAREDSTDPEDARLSNLPHDEHEDFPQGE